MPKAGFAPARSCHDAWLPVHPYAQPWHDRDSSACRPCVASASGGQLCSPVVWPCRLLFSSALLSLMLGAFSDL